MNAEPRHDHSFARVADTMRLQARLTAIRTALVHVDHGAPFRVAIVDVLVPLSPAAEAEIARVASDDLRGQQKAAEEELLWRGIR